MNLPFPWKKSYGSASRGFAIIMVLGALSLLVVLVLMFLESVRNEGLSSSIYAGQLEARRAASSALEIVMSQIQEASEAKTGVWSSQPGLIRLHQAEGQQTAYKLYSSTPSSMKTSQYDAAVDDLLGKASGGDVVDLNQPIFFKGKKIYPIIDPAIYSGDKSLIDGFENTSGGSEESFKMNVRWMYLLEDGRLVTQGQLDQSHPPVSRMAFWVDDESCKVNVNTASEGVYWDVPRTDSKEDVDFSLNIPALNEYQRYPGHPAMTSLSPILTGNLLGGDFKQTGLEYQNLIYDLIPRVTQGGSEGGTKTPSKPIAADSDRLFGFIDDIAFKPSTDPDKLEISKVDSEKVGLLSFFLTANSRSPEETIYSTPRVTIWPLAKDKTKWRASEKMIAFCSKLNGNLYEFQREKALDSENDYKNISRNQDLYAYLKGMIAKTPPHLAGSLKSVWGIDADQNLTEIFDYIRSGPALQNPTAANSFTTHFKVLPGQKSALGAVTPIVINDTKGLGRCLTISQVGVVMSSWSGLPTAKRIGASVAVQFFNPAQGLTGYVPQGLKMRVTGMSNFTLAGQSLFNTVNQSQWYGIGGGHRQYPDYCNLAGFMGLSSSFSWEIQDVAVGVPYSYGGGNYSTALPEWHGSPNGGPTVDTTGPLNFSGGDLTIEIEDEYTNNVIQKVTVTIPSASLSFPTSSLQTATGGNVNETEWAWWYRYVLGSLFQVLDKDSQVIRSVVLKATSKAKGDFRMVAGRRGVVAADSIDSTYFEAPPNISGANQHDFKAATTWEGFADTSIYNFYPFSSDNVKSGEGRLVAGANYDTGKYSASYRPQANSNLNGAFMNEGYPGDWDTGLSNFGDGPFINKPDESVYVKPNALNAIDQTYIADLTKRGLHYIRWYGNSDSDALNAAGDAETWYSPNRQMPSPVMFGSLPAGVKRMKPWQTFLFSPNSAADCDRGSKVHPGWGNGIPDHILLDYFRMPVAEPYAISDPLSTAGKININFEILPFRQLKRASGIYSILKSLKLPNIPLSEAANYKSGRVQTTSYRSKIDLDASVKSLSERFKTSAGAYRTDSEVCEAFLYPEGLGYSESKSGIYNWWKTRSLTGDNLREQPYMSIYPRITTRSNVFTMHVWTQSLKKSKNTDPTKWEEGKDRVNGEYRGSYTIERYVNPQNTELPDFTKSTDKRLSDFYQFRVIQAKTITP